MFGSFFTVFVRIESKKSILVCKEWKLQKCDNHRIHKVNIKNEESKPKTCFYSKGSWLSTLISPDYISKSIKYKVNFFDDFHFFAVFRVCKLGSFSNLIQLKCDENGFV